MSLYILKSLEWVKYENLFEYFQKLVNFSCIVVSVHDKDYLKYTPNVRYVNAECSI